jgi:hypothetical protein
MRFPILAAVVTGFLAGPAGTQEVVEGGAGDGFEERRASRVVSGMRARLAGVDALLPAGSSHREVRYPFYRVFVPRELTGIGELDTEGVPAEMQTLFESRTVRRADADHVEFEGAVLVEYGEGREAGETVRRMELERGVYDVAMDLVTSDRPVTIEEPDRRIRGGGMLHDHATGLTHFTGGVTMVMYEEGEEAEIVEAEKEKPVEQPAVRKVEKPVGKPVVKPVAKPVQKPVAKPVAKPVVKPVVKPAVKTSAKPKVKPRTKERVR